jgi:hypothetical protein
VGSGRICYLERPNLTAPLIGSALLSFRGLDYENKADLINGTATVRPNAM